MSNLDDVFASAKSLEPADRLRLIARLWESLPPEHWATPSASELAEVRRRLGDYETGAAAGTPWEIFQRMLVDCAKHSPSSKKIYSAPRRFDLATIFVVMAAYSVLLGGISAFRFPPIVSGYVAAFITAVGMGQALLVGGRWPRLASVVSGMVAYFVGTVRLHGLVGHFHIDDTSELIAFAAVSTVFLGSLLGYISGVLVGSVFLLADVLRRLCGRDKVGNASEPAKNE